MVHAGVEHVEWGPWGAMGPLSTGTEYYEYYGPTISRSSRRLEGTGVRSRDTTFRDI